MRTPRSAGEVVRVAHRHYRGEPDGLCVPDDDGEDVEWCGYDWIAPVLTPDEAATLRARAEAAEAACERMRELVEAAFREGRNSAPEDYWSASRRDRDVDLAWRNSDAHDALRALAGGAS
jgi:hypothetical protein